MQSYYPVKVKTLEDYKLQILFDNNEERIFDVTPYLTDSYFEPLSNPQVFKTAKINDITVEWLGEIDICPDELYYNSTEI